MVCSQGQKANWIQHVIKAVRDVPGQPGRKDPMALGKGDTVAETDRG
jgi:hypothetical protein